MEPVTFDSLFATLDKFQRDKFEAFIQNNRMDGPEFSMRRDKLTGNYEDPRLAVGWACWRETDTS